MSKKLFSDFEPVSAKAWKQKIQVDLKGADYNDTLVWQTNDGINVKPFYHQDTLENTLYIKPQTWSIGQIIFAQNANVANKKAKKNKLLYSDFSQFFISQILLSYKSKLH